MISKIKFRRGSSTTNKKIDKGEPYFDYTNGDLYIGTQDGGTIDNNSIKIGEIPNDIGCETLSASTGIVSNSIVSINIEATGTMKASDYNVGTDGKLIPSYQHTTAISDSTTMLATFDSVMSNSSHLSYYNGLTSIMIDGVALGNGTIFLLESFNFTVDDGGSTQQRCMQRLTAARSSSGIDTVAVFVRSASYPIGVTNWSGVSWNKIS